MHRIGKLVLALCLAAQWVAWGGDAFGGEKAYDGSLVGWHNKTELSYITTSGNSDYETFGLKNTFGRRWAKQKFTIKFDGLSSDTSDDWFLQSVPGIRWDIGAVPEIGELELIKPERESDVDRIFIEGTYSRQIRNRWDWRTGSSWDRNEDAGIISRWIYFTTAGTHWFDGDRLKFDTSYGPSYTVRAEETPDPLKDDRFLGGRLDSDLKWKLLETTTFENDTNYNVSFKDRGDYTVNMINSISVKMNSWLSLKLSHTILYNSEPALEDVDVVVRVVVIDPDGIPSSGDEFFETVAEGGAEITVGEEQVRKEPLDTTFRATILIDFHPKAKDKGGS
jgi:putative salt-induced outer membrane protein YdiY